MNLATARKVRGHFRWGAILLAGALCASAGCSRKIPTLSLLVWEGCADPLFVGGLEQSHNCKTAASYMGSSDELVAKLRGGSAGNYDVISPSSDVAMMIATAPRGGRNGPASRPVLPSGTSPTAAHPALPPAEIILTHARIYTVNRRQAWAEAVAISAGKLMAVGTEAEVAPFRGPATRVLDARGRLVLPGFTDSHIHFREGSIDASRAQLGEAESVPQLIAILKKYAASHPAPAWILGRGWVYSLFGEAALPDKKTLDEVFPDRPVWLEAYDGHTYWVNSKALALAAITRDTPDPPNGRIVRDPKTGEPTGALKEDTASALVERVFPVLSRSELIAALRRSLAEAASMGIVRIHSAGSDFEVLDVYDELQKKGQLTLRIYAAYLVNPPRFRPEELETLDEARRRYHDDWLRAGAVKFFMDGVVESHTAAMLVPYSDDPGLNGQMFWEPAAFREAVAELDRRGFQIFTHAIGDAAVRFVLDTYEYAGRTNHTSDARHRIEHIETVSAADIPRFGSLGVIASMQPLHAYPDVNTFAVWARNVGPERTSRAFAWQSIARAGGHLAFGSDWQVVTMNPWRGLQNAVTRETINGKPPGGWVPAQRVTLEQAVEAYTLDAAFAGHRETTEGSIEPGKLADLIIVSQDIFKVDPHMIGETEVLLTMVGGKIVYQSPAMKDSQ